MFNRGTIFLVSLLLSTSTITNSQTIGKKIKEIKSSPVSIVSVDRLGNFFIAAKNNTIKKFDPQGKVTASLKNRYVTLLEPWYHPTIFTYNHQKQFYTSYGRNFENEKTILLDPAWAIEPALVCPTNDNKIWIYDATDFSIKKVNPNTSEVLFEFSLDTTKLSVSPAITHLREYQNLIFLLDKNSGIIMLNNIGKQIHKIEKSGIGSFNFFGEQLYYLDENTIKFVDLSSTEVQSLEIEGDNIFVLVTDERLILVNKKNRILIFEFTP